MIFSISGVVIDIVDIWPSSLLIAVSKVTMFVWQIPVNNVMQRTSNYYLHNKNKGGVVAQRYGSRLWCWRFRVRLPAGAWLVASRRFLPVEFFSRHFHPPGLIGRWDRDLVLSEMDDKLGGPVCKLRTLENHWQLKIKKRTGHQRPLSGQNSIQFLPSEWYYW